MPAKKRMRRVGSVKQELLKKAQEAALAAVQIFNNPNIAFKSEIFIVLMHIAWTYLLHAYYRKQRVEYRYYKQGDKRRRFDRTKRGAYKHWQLETCLNADDCPLDKDTKNNLRFLIGLRHEIEHQMTTRLDDYLSARFQACCLNFNHYMKLLFGDSYGIDSHLAFSLQLSAISEEQRDMLSDAKGLPKHIKSYIEGFDVELPDEEYGSARFAYRVLFVPKVANRRGQADRVIEFVKADSPLAKGLNTEYAVIKETERPKYLPSQIVAMMWEEGFVRFNMHHHTTLWKAKDAKNPGKGYGVKVAKAWYWYERWVEVVRLHCKQNRALYQ